MKHLKLFEGYVDKKEHPGFITDESKIMDFFRHKSDYVEKIDINKISVKDGVVNIGSYDDFIDNDERYIEIKLGTLEYFPFQFGEVYGNISVSGLRSLKGAPSIVNDFYIANGLLTSLEHSPKEVIGDFSFYNNPIVHIDSNNFPTYINGHRIANPVDYFSKNLQPSSGVYFLMEEKYKKFKETFVGNGLEVESDDLKTHCVQRLIAWFDRINKSEDTSKAWNKFTFPFEEVLDSIEKNLPEHWEILNQEKYKPYVNLYRRVGKFSGQEEIDL